MSGAIVLSEDFENGTNGAAISTSNTNFDAITGTATMTFDNSTQATGSYSMNLVSTGAGGNYGAGRLTLPATQGIVYVRIALKLSAYAASNSYIFTEAETISGNPGQLRIDAAGTITIKDNTVGVGTSTNLVPLNTWFFVEWSVNWDTSLQTVKYYSTINATTPTETFTGVYTGTPITDFHFGLLQTIAANFWMDAIAVSMYDWVGPPSLTPSAAWLHI